MNSKLDMKKTYLILTLIVALAGWSQQDPQIAFYQQHLQLYNPAATGVEGYTSINTTLRNQWQGLEDSPRVQAFTLSFPGREKRLSYGAMIMVDKTFVERQTRLFATFSYRLPLGNSNSLYLGVQGGGNNVNLNFNGINLAHQDDSELDNFSRFYPNVGVGAYIQLKKVYLALSAPLLFSHKKNKEADAINPTPADDMHVYFSGGVRLPAFARDWEYIASTLMRWVPNAPSTTVFNAGLAYQKSELTLAYHHNGSLGGNLLIDTGGVLSMGYAYQFPTQSLISKLNSGNHEIILRIRLDNKSATPPDEIIADDEQNPISFNN